MGKKPSRRERKEARLKAARAGDRGLPAGDLERRNAGPDLEPEDDGRAADEAGPESGDPPRGRDHDEERAADSSAAKSARRARDERPPRRAEPPSSRAGREPPTSESARAPKGKRSNRTWALLLGLVALASIFAYYSFDRSNKTRDVMVPVDVPRGTPTGPLSVVGAKPGAPAPKESAAAAASSSAPPGVVTTPPIDSSPPTVVPADPPKSKPGGEPSAPKAPAPEAAKAPPKIDAPKTKPKPASDPY